MSSRTDAQETSANLGRWFATAVSPDETTARAPVSRRGLPRMPAWGPDPRGGYGQVSDDATVRAALDVLLADRETDGDATAAADTPTDGTASGSPGDPTRSERPAPSGVTVLTGAGMSTGAGLPDYRGADSVARAPMTAQEFIGSDLARRRYWARSTVGWTQFNRARPGRSHRLLAALEPALGVRQIITQNVDALHQQAGSPHVIDLHGRLDTIRCLSCGARTSREAHHERLLAMNPQVAARLPELAANAAQAPDGDAEVDRTSDFRYPLCPLCGGMLKPDVVYFGEGATREHVDAAFAVVEASSGLLVLGSSLTVMSGLRFVRRAAKLGRSIVVVNDGPTRADDIATVRVHGRIEDVLGRWQELLGP